MALFWSNVGVDVQTALGTAVTITGISKANPGVVTHGGTDPSNGDYVLLTVVGMHQVDSRIFRVANAGVGTFELEGEDSTSYDTFTSGTFEVITYGASMSTAQNINVSGGEPEFSDVTTIHDNVRKRVPTITSPMSLSFDCIYDATDAAQVEMQAAHKALSPRAIQLRFSNGTRMLFSGYVSASGVPTGQAQGVVQTRVSVESQGLPTVYSS